MPVAGLRYRNSSKKKTDKEGKIKVLNMVKGKRILRSLRISRDTCCAWSRAQKVATASYQDY